MQKQSAHSQRVEKKQVKRRAHQRFADARSRQMPRRVSRCRANRAGGAAVRWELVRRIRARIAAGDYLTEPRIDGAIDRLLAQLAAKGRRSAAT